MSVIPIALYCWIEWCVITASVGFSISITMLIDMHSGGSGSSHRLLILLCTLVLLIVARLLSHMDGKDIYLQSLNNPC